MSSSSSISCAKEEEESNNGGGQLLLQRVETRATTMAAQQFLNSVLSQRGPSSLPYPEDVKWLIRQHLLSLSSEFPSLHPRTSTFTHNDGRSVNLLRAEGTIPISFQGATYNLPILIWLTESYPHRPPSVFLNPTRDMLIKRPHPLVNPSGLVSSPLLLHWLYPSSNLLDLSRSLSLLFGLDPPLFSRPPTLPSNPNSSFSSSLSTNSNDFIQIPSSETPNSSSSKDYGVFLPTQNRPSENPNSSSSTASYGLSIPNRNRPSENPNSSVSMDDYRRIWDGRGEEAHRRDLMSKVVERVGGDLGELRREREGEMEGVLELQRRLRGREGELRKGLREMVDEKEGLEQQLQMVLMNSDVLGEWVRRNEVKVEETVNFSSGNAFEPFDVISKQMLDCTSSDLAIEDVIYALDKAAQDGRLPFDQYLKNVRLLSREQFFHRAMATKIRSVAVHSHISRMAARASHVS